MKAGTKHSEESKQLMRERRKGLHAGADHYAWKGGRYVNPDGYVLVLLDSDHPNYAMAGVVGNGTYVFEHRLVMAAALGRNLVTEEVVHHENGVKDDNRLSNLRLFKSHDEHQRHHELTRERTTKGTFV